MIKLGVLGFVIMTGYVIFNPDVVADPAQREKLEGIRSGIAKIGDTIQGKTTIISKGFIPSDTWQKISSSGVVLGEKEINVDSVVGEISSRLKTLPASQLNEIRAKMCSDLFATESSKSVSN